MAFDRKRARVTAGSIVATGRDPQGDRGVSDTSVSGDVRIINGPNFPGMLMAVGSWAACLQKVEINSATGQVTVFVIVLVGDTQMGVRQVSAPELVRSNGRLVPDRDVLLWLKAFLVTALRPSFGGPGTWVPDDQQDSHDPTGLTA